jgi:hypothetical protein
MYHVDGTPDPYVMAYAGSVPAKLPGDEVRHGAKD